MDYKDFNDYQVQARSTAIYPDLGSNLWYPTLGLSGEAGEVAEKVKKVYRDSAGIVSPDARLAIVKELGDVLWYVSNVASEVNVRLGTIARVNITKLLERESSGKLHGSGDNR